MVPLRKSQQQQQQQQLVKEEAVTKDCELCLSFSEEYLKYLLEAVSSESSLLLSYSEHQSLAKKPGSCAHTHGSSPLILRYIVSCYSTVVFCLHYLTSEELYLCGWFYSVEKPFYQKIYILGLEIGF